MDEDRHCLLIQIKLLIIYRYKLFQVLHNLDYYKLDPLSNSTVTYQV